MSILSSSWQELRHYPHLWCFFLFWLPPKETQPPFLFIIAHPHRPPI